MGLNEPNNVILSPATAINNANIQPASFNYDVLILECLIRNVSFGDLLNCRLVCKEWASAATKVVKIRSKMVRLNCGPTGRIDEFVKMLRGRDDDRCLPFGRYRVNMTENFDMAGPYLSEFFEHISGEKCFQLFLSYFADCKDKIAPNIMEGAKSREGKMGFVSLEELHVFIELDGNFVDLAMLNLSELLEKSNGLKKLKLFSDLNDYQMTIDADLQLLKCLTMKANNFKTLETLDLTMVRLDAILVENLLDFDWALKNLTFDGADFFHDWMKGEKDPQKGRAFYKLLEKQSGSLESLALLDFGDRIFESDDFNHPAMCSLENKFKFPKMPKLLSLEIQPPEYGWICCNWDFKEKNSFLYLFPQLKKLDLHELLSTSKLGNLDFLPNPNYPCETLEELAMPSFCDGPGNKQRSLIFYNMILLFPNLRKLEVWYDEETLQAIFLTLQKLKSLWIHNLGNNYNWDAIFAGDPQIKGVDEQTVNQAEDFEHGVTPRVPRIDNLQDLEELVVEACRSLQNITDVTGNLLLKMDNLKIVKFYVSEGPHPEEHGSIKWLFSPSCENKLRQHVNLILQYGIIRDFIFPWDKLAEFYDQED